MAIAALAFSTPQCRAFDLQPWDSDIVWHNPSTHQSYVWFMQPRFEKIYFNLKDTSAFIPSHEGAAIVATADFNNDGHTDLLWRYQSSGQNWVSLMNGMTVTTTVEITTGNNAFYVVGTGDFNKDGHADILWWRQSDNFLAVWYMENENYSGTGGQVTPWVTDLRWKPRAVGDANHDGYADIYWQDKIGVPVKKIPPSAAIWIMNGLEWTTSKFLSAYPSGSDWTIMTTGHFAPVGNTDLLWRDPAMDQNAIWCMREETQIYGALIDSLSSPWTMAGTGGYSNMMTLSASVVASPPSVTLCWRFGEPGPLTIKRKTPAETSWTTLTPNHRADEFTDTSGALAVGERYEYMVGDNYILTGINASPVENRGKVILVVDNTIAGDLATDLDAFTTNLVGDGWSVVRTDVQRHDDSVWANNTNAIAQIRGFIANAYNADPENAKAVLLIGHVPMPHSGNPNPDNHGFRALPADNYYGDVDG